MSTDRRNRPQKPRKRQDTAWQETDVHISATNQADEEASQQRVSRALKTFREWQQFSRESHIVIGQPL